MRFLSCISKINCAFASVLLPISLMTMVLPLSMPTFAFVINRTRLQQQYGRPSSASFLSLVSERAQMESMSNKLAWNLIDKINETGQIGTKVPEAEQVDIAALAAQLSDLQCESAIEIPTDATLTGTHELLYSMSPGGSSGAIGPFVGKVTQEFVDEVKFINTVQLGPFTIELHAVREVIDNVRIRVKFQETVVRIFGVEITRKETKGAGVWKQLFVGEVYRGNDRRLLRVMETPSLFVIQQPLSSS